MRRNVLCVLLAALVSQSAAFQPLLTRGLQTRVPLRQGVAWNARPRYALPRPARPTQRHGLAGLTAQADLASSIAPVVNAISSGLVSVSGAAALCSVIAFHEAGHFLAARAQVRCNTQFLHHPLPGGDASRAGGGG